MEGRELCQASQGEAHVWSVGLEKSRFWWVYCMTERKLCCYPQIWEVSLSLSLSRCFGLHQSAHETEIPPSTALRSFSIVLTLLS